MHRSLIAVGLAVTFSISTGALAQQANSNGGSAGSDAQQTAPNAPQPQQAGPNPSNKSNKKKESSKASSTGKPAAEKPQAGGDQNPFPEGVSEKAAQAAGSDQAPTNSSSSAKPAGKQASQEKNPFPEDVSRKAAEAAAGKNGGSTAVPSKPAKSSGEASSLDGGIEDQGGGDAPAIEDPHRAKQDNSVADFYMGRGDYKGAYMRYQDAMKYDPGDIDAVFGAAEAARKLGNRADAMREYQLYLAVEPNGSKAKRALKALAELTQKK